MCGATSSLRFPGQLNGDLRKMSVNLVPFPRLHFFTTAFAPFSSEGGKSHQATKVSDLAMQLFNPTNQMVAVSVIRACASSQLSIRCTVRS